MRGWRRKQSKLIRAGQLPREAYKANNKRNDHRTIRRFKMDIIITMAYTALMTFIAVKVVEHTPSENNRK